MSDGVTTTGDYVLGTGSDELSRLGLQHRAWRPHMLAGWQRAGITVGATVLDVGCGPGYATVDAAEMVGPAGRVIGLERSPAFLEHARESVAQRGLSNVELYAIDLIEDAWSAANVDVAWCRWVACFVTSPETLVQKIAAALKPGGRVIFHEYIDYGAWKYVPRLEPIESFVQEVIANWRASGGEPDIAAVLPQMLESNGIRVHDVRPLAFAVRRPEMLWHWPMSFVDTHVDRLLELGRVDAAWVRGVRASLKAAYDDPTHFILTPTVLEIIGTKS